MQHAARQFRLDQVGGVHRAIAAPGPHEGMHLVDEQDDLAFGGFDLLEHGLQPFLELTTELGASHQRAHVEREQLLVLQRLGHVAIDDALGQPLDNRGLAHARFTDQDGIVLAAPGQNLNGAADFLITPDHGSSLPSCATSVTSRAYFFSASKLASAFSLVTVRPLRMAAIALSSACGVAPPVRRA